MSEDDQTSYDFYERMSRLSRERYIDSSVTIRESMDQAADQLFPGILKHLCERAHDTAVSKGWWIRGVKDDIHLKVLLVITEIAEAVDVLRQLECTGTNDPRFVEELADAAIRIMDICGRYDIPLGEAILAKMKQNRDREHRHGGKKF